jgi:hypothetical protein
MPTPPLAVADTDEPSSLASVATTAAWPPYELNAVKSPAPPHRQTLRSARQITYKNDPVLGTVGSDYAELLAICVQGLDLGYLDHAACRLRQELLRK